MNEDKVVAWTGVAKELGELKEEVGVKESTVVDELLLVTWTEVGGCFRHEKNGFPMMRQQANYSVLIIRLNT